MKKFYAILAISIVAFLPNTVSHAQKIKDSVSIELPCYDTKEIFKSLKEHFKEMPMLTGIAADEAESTVSIWINPLDNDWTILATKKDLTCVIGTGSNMKIIPTRKGTSI